MCFFIILGEIVSDLIKVFTSKSYLNLNDKECDSVPVLVNVCGKYSGENFSFKTRSLTGRKDYYLIYVLEGELKILLQCDTIIAQKGSVVIFPPNYKYQYFGKPPLKYFYAHFTGSYVGKLLKECNFTPLPYIKNGNSNYNVIQDFNKLLETFSLSKNLKDQKCACYLERILLSISENLTDSDKTLSLEKSLSHLHANFTKHIEIPTLSKMENLSNSHYVALFRKKFGKSPNKYIIDLRLSYACDMLANTDKPIKEIAEKVGYIDPYFFSSLFKKHLGVSPKTYRKNYFIYR